jgi:uncharacterized protein (DUF2267 family)
MKGTFIPNNRTTNLLCELLSKYRAGEGTTATLHALRDQLGDAEYANFEKDLQALMYRQQAWKAVQQIISAALERKKRALPGISQKRDERAVRTSLGVKG